MRTDLCVRAQHKGEMRVDVRVREHVLAMDYPALTGKACTPLEVLLASLAGCAANTLFMVLCGKMNVKLESLEVEARAERRSEHPTILTSIELVYQLGAECIAPEIVDRALRIAEDQLCPVLNMLRQGARISSRWEAHTPTAHA
jgi:putative redox protein